ncbi:MAG: ABC transporter substrate-binding protein [Burkholderiales bacterium]|nr:ABC transporter substrate-binding protein [Burkholderiales bacterium]
MTLLAAAGALALPAHSAQGPRRIGWIAYGPAALTAGWTTRIRARLREPPAAEALHEERVGDGSDDGVDRAARELAAWRPEIVVAMTNGATRAAMRHMPNTPIVVLSSANPVEFGIAATLARPGGNVTGAAANPPEVAGKWLEILQAAAPHIRRVAVFLTLNTPGFAAYTPHAMRAAQRLGMTLHYIEPRPGDPIDMAAVEAVKPDALYVVLGGSNARRLIAYALEHKLPSISFNRDFVEASGLFTFMPDPEEGTATVSDYVQRILKGAPPGGLPFREPSRFQLIVNAQTARAIGISITPELRLRANEVIEVASVGR